MSEVKKGIHLSQRITEKQAQVLCEVFENAQRGYGHGFGYKYEFIVIPCVLIEKCQETMKSCIDCPLSHSFVMHKEEDEEINRVSMTFKKYLKNNNWSEASCGDCGASVKGWKYLETRGMDCIICPICIHRQYLESCEIQKEEAL